MKYNAKVVMSGHVVELYEYEKEVRIGKDNEIDKPVGRRGKRKEGLEWIDEESRQLRDKEKNREDVLRRARQRVRRLINANVDAWGEKAKFFTLTFRENVQDMDKANEEFKKFRQRLSRHVWGRDKPNALKYVAVVEFQKRGAIHYHVVTFNMPYVPHKELLELWGHGAVHIEKIDDCDNVGAYMTKYMAKGLDDERLREKKCYFCSRGLAEPKEEIIKKEDLNALRVALSPNKVYENQFENEQLGKICYEQYNLKRR